MSNRSPVLSQRSENIPASPIRMLVPFADDAKARGIHVHHLNIGQPDLMPPDGYWEGVNSVRGEMVDYSNSLGILPLREKVAENYRELGLNVSTQDVMITTAGSEALLFAITATCDPDDEVIVPEPMYANYIGFSATVGVKVVPIPTRIEENFRLPSLEEFESKITPKTKAIIICNPNNPTGAVYSDDQLEGLGEIAKRHGLFLIADEVYRVFNYTGKPIRSVLQLEGLDQHTIMIDSASKRFSLCGARVGFLVSRNKELMDVALRLGQARLSSPKLEQYGVLNALNEPPSYYEAVREEYIKRRDVLTERLKKIPGVVVPQIDGAFYATVALPVEDADDFCRWLLTDFNYENETVMLAPASGFYSTPGSGKNEVRIAYVLHTEKLERCMDLLEIALKAYNQ
jgi:aspartate aminotransferase